MLCQPPHRTSDGCGGLRTPPVSRGLRDFAGDHCREQRPLGAIVGRLDPWVCQEAQQVARIMMPAEFGEQPLIVRILQVPVAQLRGDLCLQWFGFRRQRPAIGGARIQEDLDVHQQPGDRLGVGPPGRSPRARPRGWRVTR
jgi:hypothetical protein